VILSERMKRVFFSGDALLRESFASTSPGEGSAMLMVKGQLGSSLLRSIDTRLMQSAGFGLQFRVRVTVASCTGNCKLPYGPYWTVAKVQ